VALIYSFFVEVLRLRHDRIGQKNNQDFFSQRTRCSAASASPKPDFADASKFAIASSVSGSFLSSVCACVRIAFKSLITVFSVSRYAVSVSGMDAVEQQLRDRSSVGSATS
jgi:hypothetical protein